MKKNKLFNKRHRNSAFTLIELIVVMSVLAILVLLALPKLTGYTERAQFTKDVQTAKVLETAIDTYLINGGSLKDDLEVVDITLIQESAGQKNVLGVDGFIEDVETNTYYELTYEFIRDKLDVKISRSNNALIEANAASSPRAAYVAENGKTLIDRNKVMAGYIEPSPSEPGNQDGDDVVTEPDIEWPPTEPLVPVTPEGYFTFNPTTKTITKFYPTGINGTLDKITDVVIPEIIGGVEVVNVGGTAFKECSLTSVYIPSNVKSIGSWAFQNNKIVTLTIANGVQSIQREAFDNNLITSVFIPETLVSMEYDVFKNNDLSTLRIPDSLRGASTGHAVFSGQSFDSVHIYRGVGASSLVNVFALGTSGPKTLSITDLVIEEGVTEIGVSAFNSVKLGTVSLPETLTAIRNTAFAGAGLTNISIPDSVAVIGSGAFRYNLLTEIEIPASLTSISGYAFSMNKLKAVTIPANITSIGAWAFQDNSISTVLFENGIQTIDREAFDNNLITSVSIPQSMVSMDYDVFKNNDLSTLRVPDTLRGVSTNHAIFSGQNFDSVQVYRGVGLSSLANVFSFSTSGPKTLSITNLVIEEDVMEIGPNAFNSVKIATVSLPETLTAIRNTAFAGAGLTNISIPDSVAVIGSGAFSYNKLISVRLPNSLISLSSTTFNYNGLTSASTSSIPTIVNDVKGKTFNMVDNVWIMQ